MDGGGQVSICSPQSRCLPLTLLGKVGRTLLAAGKSRTTWGSGLWMGCQWGRETGPLGWFGGAEYSLGSASG